MAPIDYPLLAGKLYRMLTRIGALTAFLLAVTNAEGAKPTITKIDPSPPPAGSRNRISVTITGTGFQNNGQRHGDFELPGGTHKGRYGSGVQRAYPGALVLCRSFGEPA